MLLVLSPKRKRVSPIFALIHLLPHHDTRIGGGVYVLEIPSILGIRESSVYAMQFYSNCFEFSDVVLEVMRNIPAWPGRHLLEGGEHRRYFALKTVARGVVEFECRNQREYDVWTQGVSRLLIIAAEKNNKHRI